MERSRRREEDGAEEVCTPPFRPFSLSLSLPVCVRACLRARVCVSVCASS